MAACCSQIVFKIGTSCSVLSWLLMVCCSPFGVKSLFTFGQNLAAALLVGGLIFGVHFPVAGIKVTNFTGADFVPLFQALADLLRCRLGSPWCAVPLALLGGQLLHLLSGWQLDKLTRKKRLFQVHTLGGTFRLYIQVLTASSLFHLAKLGGQLPELLPVVDVVFYNSGQQLVFNVLTLPGEGVALIPAYHFMFAGQL